jgi:hypothetical protein
VALGLSAPVNRERIFIYGGAYAAFRRSRDCQKWYLTELPYAIASLFDYFPNRSSTAMQMGFRFFAATGKHSAAMRNAGLDAARNLDDLTLGK